ncbi:alcohol dehydrogenase catalytic domain-containing protein [Methylococcus sp. EFPC2]|uniref:MDR/zinc-dependent alcohol dehydrogenase-like family protein n=1 Tax=Methylococcus sp. EFPC2 TaxID=2812648 RepID=UPI00196879B8|nr:alcohol dehydrogenase catalytic domain-containing protein [Methylococcus sp. EFPC2]QSA95501.1 alcohol dehydrogenase catalytic domain-containing protein [Methylococcus sp. EFPC2]
MRAVWLERQKLFPRDDLPPPRMDDGEALLRVRLAGICGTDLQLLRGYYPYAGIPGHEFVGEVVEASDESWIGRRVVGDINVACGQCPACRSDRARHCERRSVLGIRDRAGAFAEYLTLPLDNLHRVPDNVPDEAAVFAEPLAAALEIQEQTPIHPGDRVLVVGAGRLGQLIAQTLALTGCDLRVVARHSRQREILALSGISTVMESEVASRQFDIVVEASGSPTGFELARRAVRPQGTLILKSTYAGELTLNLSSLVVDELTLVGSRCGPIDAALRLLGKQAVDPAPLIECRYPLSAALAAFEHAARPGVLKVLLEP